MKKRAADTVGRGPVSRHASVEETAVAGGFRVDRAIAGDRPPRYDKKRYPLTVARGPSDATRASERVSLAMRLAVRPPHLCRSRSPDLDPFVIRRSQTTERDTHIRTMEIAGDRPPRYDKKRYPLTVGRGPVPRHASRSRNPTCAGDKPPRYGKIETGKAILHGFMNPLK